MGAQVPCRRSDRARRPLRSGGRWRELLQVPRCSRPRQVSRVSRPGSSSAPHDDTARTIMRGCLVGRALVVSPNAPAGGAAPLPARHSGRRRATSLPVKESDSDHAEAGFICGVGHQLPHDVRDGVRRHVRHGFHRHVRHGVRHNVRHNVRHYLRHAVHSVINGIAPRLTDPPWRSSRYRASVCLGDPSATPVGTGRGRGDPRLARSASGVGSDDTEPVAGSDPAVASSVSGGEGRRRGPRKPTRWLVAAGAEFVLVVPAQLNPPPFWCLQRGSQRRVAPSATAAMTHASAREAATPVSQSAPTTRRSNAMRILTVGGGHDGETSDMRLG